MQTVYTTKNDPRHDPRPAPDAVPFRRAVRFSDTIEGLGVVSIVPWAGQLVIRHIPAGETWDGTGERPDDGCTINGKRYRLDIGVNREGGRAVAKDRGTFGVLAPEGSFSHGGTPSAERKAVQMVQAWADRYALEHMNTTGAANTHNEASRHLTDAARILADAYADVMARIDALDDATPAELASSSHMPYELRKDEDA